jgi:chemotaxis protein MotB
MLVVALHGYAVAGRGRHEAAGTAKDGRFSFRAGGGFGAVVGLLGSAGPRLFFAQGECVWALHLESPTIVDDQVGVKWRPLTREDIVRHTSKLAGMFLVGALFAVGCGPSELELKAQKDLKDLQDENAKLKAEKQDLTKKLADATAAADKFKAWGTGTQADKEALQKKLAELEKAKAASEAREAMFRSLAEKLRSMVDAGQIKVTVRNGRMLLVLPNDILFDSGKVEIKEEGKSAIANVAKVLAGMADRHFLVAGHTDNVPIKTKKFRSNWELSTQRAVEVTRLLVEGGMKPSQLGAAGYADFDPAASNDTPDGQKQNRRIEIVVEPNLSELPNLDNLGGKPAAK